MRSVQISTKPFIFYLFLVGVTVQSAESLSAAISLGASTERANSKRAIHGWSHLFQDAVLSVSSWLRSFPVHGWWTRSLSSVSGPPTCWRYVHGWLMCLLWAYEHDFAALLPFLSEKIGTLCRHPFRSLWLKQRTAGWRPGRSEGHSKSLSARYVPTDLLLLTQRTFHPLLHHHDHWLSVAWKCLKSGQQSSAESRALSWAHLRVCSSLSAGHLPQMLQKQSF